MNKQKLSKLSQKELRYKLINLLEIIFIISNKKSNSLIRK